MGVEIEFMGCLVSRPGGWRAWHRVSCNPAPACSRRCRVTIAVAADGRPNGMGFVEFESPEAAAAAQTKHRQMMGTRYVEIFASSSEERARYVPL